MTPSFKIYIPGHNGMVGSALVRRLQEQGFNNLLLRSRRELDLLDQAAVKRFFAQEKPEYVFLAAAKVGGIVANNTFRAQFIYENLQIQNNVIHFAHESGVKKLLFLGSSCIYPKMAPQPIKEEYLLTGPLEATNEPYAIAKIAGIKMCQAYRAQYGDNFISVMPTNLYGPNDNYDLDTSHAMPAMIRKLYLAARLERGDWAAIHDDLNKRPVSGINGQASNNDILSVLAKHGIRLQDQRSESQSPDLPTFGPSDFQTSRPVTVSLWGTGKPKREFLHVDDLADACLFLMGNYDGPDFFNIGTGEDIAIADLAGLIADIVDFNGDIRFDADKPDGTPRKWLDISRLRNLGWRHRIELRQGVRQTFEAY